MSDQANIVELQDVAKSYLRGRQVVEVLRHFQLTVEEGEFLAILGPSGSGKSTLLNLIGGIDRPSSGTVTVASQQISEIRRNDLAAWRARNIGFVFQFYNLLPSMTARFNIEVPLLLTSLTKTERAAKVELALELVGLKERSDHRPSELSGGEQQRVAIARAIVADPSLLICDEPTGDLDGKTAQDIFELLSALSRYYRKTCIVVSHDTVVTKHASRVVTLDKGQVTSPLRE